MRAGQVELEGVEGAAQGLRQDAVARRVGLPLEAVLPHHTGLVEEVLREPRRAQPGLLLFGGGVVIVHVRNTLQGETSGCFKPPVD